MKWQLLIWMCTAVGRLPFGVLGALGVALGTLLAFLPARISRTTRTNLDLCFAETDQVDNERLVRQSLQHTGRLIFECLYLWSRPVGQSLTLIESASGEQHIEEQLATGRGVVCIVPHAGNWELLNFHLAARFPLTALYQPPLETAIDVALQRVRGAAGGRFHPAGIGGVRAMLRALRRGELACVLPDQVPNAEGGVYAPFFNRPALTATLVGNLVARTGCVAVIAVAERNASTGRFRVLVEAVPELASMTDPVALAAAINQQVERVARRAPAQYLWSYKRFKHPPNAAPDPYKRRRLDR